MRSYSIFRMRKADGVNPLASVRIQTNLRWNSNSVKKMNIEKSGPRRSSSTVDSDYLFHYAGLIGAVNFWNASISNVFVCVFYPERK